MIDNVGDVFSGFNAYFTWSAIPR